MSTNEGDEEFQSSWLGECNEVYEKNIGDNDFIFFDGCKQVKTCSIIIRGPNEYMIDEVDRSIHDALCVIRRTLESNKVVAGGGACEVSLSIHLDDFAKTLGSKEQIAISEFSEALLVIPKVLANNAALDAIDLIAKLKTLHHASQNSDDPTRKELRYAGLDLINNKCRNNLKAGVLEPANSKIKSIRFATEAAITILRIDDFIKLAPK